MSNTKKTSYQLRADISTSSEKIIKNTAARLRLNDKPDNIADAVNYICSEFEKQRNK